jgi:hypothetical protein
MINQFLDKRMAALFRATLVGSGILCFLLPAAGFYKIAGLGLSSTQSLLGAGIVAGLTIQAMILFAVVGVAEEIFVKRSRKSCTDLKGFPILRRGE